MSDRCQCQDSAGVICGKIMTAEEKKQDGMCSDCADNVWEEMHSEEEYVWYHDSDK